MKQKHLKLPGPVISDSSILIKAGTTDLGTTPFTQRENDALAEPLKHVSKHRARKGRSPGERGTGPFGSPAFAFIVLALPALWVGWLVYSYGVDTPWGDEWDSTRLLLEKMQGGTLGLGDFFAFHNEHRIFFPRVLTFGLALLTHWNVRAELLMIWILACVCSFNLWRVAQITGWRNSPTRLWLLLGTNVLLFSPMQWENLLWGFQIGFFLPLATMTACLWVAPALRRPFDFLATIVLCLVSTFSIASGFAAWFLTAPLLLRWNNKTPAQGEKIWWLGWFFVGTASICLCFRGYAQPAAHPSVWEAWKHPFRAMQFLLAYLGTPFFGTVPDVSVFAPIASTALLIIFGACLLYLWRSRRNRTLVSQSLPWVLLAASAVVNAFLTMLGRLGFGISAATQSRYVSFAVMLPIGLLFLAALVFRHWREHSHIGAGTVGKGRGLVVSGTAVLGTALLVLFVCGTIKSLEIWKRFQHNCLSGKAALLLINVVDEPDVLVHHVHWAGPALKDWANALDRMGYFRPALLRSNRVREIAFHPGPETMGELNDLGKGAEGEFAARGWAILPDKHRIADGVLLTYDDAQGEPRIFALAEVSQVRSDISRQLNDKAYLRSGWDKTWKTGRIPANSQLIRAWAFDAEDLRAFQIGSFSLDPPIAAP